MAMTADEQYAANMALLVQHPSEDLRRMPEQLATVPLTNVQLIPNARGNIVGGAWSVAQQQWIGLCDGEDPIGQAERAVEAIYASQTRVFTICGMGLGYAAAALARRLKPYQRLSIWELSPSLYKAMFYCLDVTPLFSEKRVHFFVGPDAAQHVEGHWLTLETQEKLGIAMPLVGEYALQVDKAGYEAVFEKTSDMLRHHMVGLSTWKIFGKDIGDNDLRNLPEYFTSPGYEHLEGLWQGRPAVCVAAGPSLQKNLRQLLPPDVRDRVALITSGTTYALVQGLHLCPDIVTTIDFQRLNWTDQFQHVPFDPDCPLVYLHSTYPQTVRRWPGPKFVAENASDTVQFFRRFGEGKKHAAQIQTVAHLNLLVALMMGASPILLLGQDLSMPPAQHHAAGARAQDQAPAEVPPEAFMTMADYTGQPTATRHSFLSMKTVFERIAADNPSRMILNCTEGGLALAGIPNVSLANALTMYLPQVKASRGELRTAVKRTWQGYTPTISEEVLPALATLQAEAKTLATIWAPGVLQWQRQRDRWEDRDPEADMLHDGLGDAAVAAILATQGMLAACNAAFGLFVIRHFGLVELMATLPPGEEWMTDMRVQERYTADRLVATARLVLEVADDVHVALHEAAQRMADVVASAQHALRRKDILGLLARQQYGVVARWLTTGKAMEEVTGLPWSQIDAVRLQGQVQYHTQQYEAALATLEPWGLAPAHTGRMRRHMAQHAADIRLALPAYFEQQTTQSLPMLPSGGGQYEGV